MTARDRLLFAAGVVLAAATFLAVFTLFTNGTPR